MATQRRADGIWTSERCGNSSSSPCWCCVRCCVRGGSLDPAGDGDVVAARNCRFGAAVRAGRASRSTRPNGSMVASGGALDHERHGEVVGGTCARRVARRRLQTSVMRPTASWAIRSMSSGDVSGWSSTNRCADDVPASGRPLGTRSCAIPRSRRRVPDDVDVRIGTAVRTCSVRASGAR